jgi:hypothetical protein
MAELKPVMSVAELDAFMDREFPEMRMGADTTRIVGVGPGTATLRLGFSERNLRPGGTISGPAMMALADYAMYAAVLAHIGPVGLGGHPGGGAAFEARAGAGGRRDRDVAGGRGGACRPCELHLFDPAAVKWGILLPHG